MRTCSTSSYSDRENQFDFLESTQAFVIQMLENVRENQFDFLESKQSIYI